MERQICSPENPMPKDAKGYWAHTNVIEIGTCKAGCCVIYRCLDCKHEWQEELPQ